MKKTNWLFLFLVIFLAFGLTACERSLSTPPPDEPVEESEIPLPDESTPSPIEELSAFATQTAMPEAAEAAADTVDTEAGEATVAEAAEAGEGEAAEPDAETETAAEAATGAETATTGETEDQAGGGEVGGTDAEVGGGQVTNTEALGEVADSYEVPGTYVLQGGEFPFCIARRFDVDISALLSASGLASGGTYYAGTALTIPQGAKPFNGPRALRTHPAPYTVLTGDTVNSIACLFGDVDPRAIIDLNNLDANGTLSVGQQIQIP